MIKYEKKMREYTLISKELEYCSVKLNSSKDTYNYMKDILYGCGSIDIYETAYIILLNNPNNVIGFAKIGQGGVSACIVDPILIAKYIADTLARKVILVHNHPSGFLKPSSDDDKLTSRISQMVKLFNSQLVDHLIMTSNGYYSYADEGTL